MGFEPCGCHPGLLTAQIGERRIAAALDKLLDVELRLAVAEQIQPLHILPFCITCFAGTALLVGMPYVVFVDRNLGDRLGIFRFDPLCQRVLYVFGAHVQI